MKEREQLPRPQGRLGGGRGLAPVGAESQSARGLTGREAQVLLAPLSRVGSTPQGARVVFCEICGAKGSPAFGLTAATDQLHVHLCRCGAGGASRAVHPDQALLALRVNDLYISDPTTASPLAQMPPLERL